MTRIRSNPWVALIVLCLGFFMILLDTTIVNIAVPSILDSLHATLDQILWVLNCYLLTYAVLLITMGRLGDLVGQRNMFAIGLAGFTIASAVCGLAQNPNELIAARAAQGVMGAIITPQTLAMLTTIFPPERRGAAFGIWGGVAGIAAVTGPTLGGFIVTNWSWRWIFYVNVPVGIVAFLATLIILPPIRSGRAHRFDVLGVVLATLGLLGVVFGLIEGQRYNWGVITGYPFAGIAVSIPVVIAAGIILLALFFIWEWFQDEPLLPLSLFTDRNFSLMNWVAAVISFAMLGLFLPLTIYLQSVLGYSALKAGLVFLPTPAISMVVAPVAGRLADRFGGKYILMLGLTCFGLGMGYIVWSAHVDSTWTDFLPGLLVAGLGMGCTFAPAQTVAMRNVTPRMAGAAAGVLNTSRQVGGVVGSAVIGAVLQNRLATELHNQAVARSQQLPAPVRARFVSGFNHAGTSGFQVGRGQNGGKIPANAHVPPAVLARIDAVAHQVFANAFVNAMRPTLAVTITVLLIGAVSTVLVVRRRGQQQPAQAQEARPVEPAAAAS